MAFAAAAVAQAGLLAWVYSDPGATDVLAYVPLLEPVLHPLSSRSELALLAESIRDGFEGDRFSLGVLGITACFIVDVIALSVAVVSCVRRWPNKAPVLWAAALLVLLTLAPWMTNEIRWRGVVSRGSKAIVVIDPVARHLALSWPETPTTISGYFLAPVPGDENRLFVGSPPLTASHEIGATDIERDPATGSIRIWLASALDCAIEFRLDYRKEWFGEPQPIRVSPQGSRYRIAQLPLNAVMQPTQ